MPFVALDCTSALLSSLGLPAKLDEKHPYRYLILQHSDGEAMLISQSLQHLYETFETEILVLGERRFLVRKHLNCMGIEYTLTDIQLYAEPSEALLLQNELATYLQDILADFRQRSSYTRVPAKVTLEVCESNWQSRAAVAGFHWSAS